MKKRILKIVAVYLALNLIAEIIAPTAAMALTAGPSQPEVQSFEPIETTEMVDPFTGDFTYNIPLMTVPGPNGGYPINLSYHSGIGMEQEASWVGLGWNINAGVINRQMRGLPDDFSGEKVTKTLSHKPNTTFGLSMTGFGTPVDEVFGLDAKIGKTYGAQLYYNNYKGIGFGFNASLNNLQMKSTSNFLKGAIDFSFDSQSGIGVQPKISYAATINDKKYIFDAGLGYHSREGLQKLWLKGERAEEKFTNEPLRGLPVTMHRPYIERSRTGKGAGTTFSGSSYVPGIATPLAGGSGDFAYKFRASTPTNAIPGFFGNRTVRGFFSRQTIKDKTLEVPAYGYMYSQNMINTDGDLGMMDFNREKEFSITKDAPSLPVPVFTNDVYMVNGQGVGAVFRPYRSDIGILYDGRMTNDFGSLEIGLEPDADHLGVNTGATYSHSYSGKWKNDSWDDLQGDYEFTGQSSDHLFEPFYFKAAGELTADGISDGEVSRFGADAPVKFRLGMRPGGSLSWEPKVFNKQVSFDGSVLSYNQRLGRSTRSQSIEYKTRGQLDMNSYPGHGKFIYSLNQLPSASNGSQIDYTVSDARNANQIGEMSVVNPDGNRYVYGLPAYNTRQKDVVFSVDAANTHKRTVTYSSTDASTANAKGIDHYYSCTELPPYVHSYMLTAIYSPDYVDLKGDGPTEDDLGYYVKFNYTRLASDYKWRIPFTDANYIPGYYSYDKDDKASYTYGEKEIWYLNSIETKTHIAQFILDARNDGMGANDELNLSTSSTKTLQAQKQLSEIRLYSKENTTTPLKAVKFFYNYSLCKGIENTSGSAPDNGKLTLTDIKFSYMGNTKGELSPYHFEYTTLNPDYSLTQMDRWGNYKPDNYSGTQYKFFDDDNPYVDQMDKSSVDQQAAAWSLSSITMPSGGVMNIQYESDDYAYVQDKPAMQMFRIVSTALEDGSGQGAGHLDKGRDSSNDVARYDRLYFDLETPTSDVNEIKKYISGISDMYFKTMMRLKKKMDGTGDAYDYVDGYCKINAQECGLDNMVGGLYTQGYVTVKFVPVAQMDNSLGLVHPFRKAAWEYMKLHRPELLYPSQNAGFENMDLNFINSFVSMFRDVRNMIFGYYNACYIQGLSGEILLDQTNGEYRPSFIRLNSPDKKKMGGGHRVKSITIDDNWDDITDDPADATKQEAAFDYGQEFEYTLPDGSSSGVAEYEPLIGGEEIPHHLPTDRFRTDRTFMNNDKDFYLEEPFGESYYPAANVGYSRVIVKNKKRTVSESDDTEINATTGSGIMVYEFYTAKDFPVKVTHTTVTHKSFSPTVYIPFVGSLDFDNNGYSQGYTIELNDMHGKPKSIATYAHNADINNIVHPPVPVTKSSYIYNTTAPYNENGPNKLLNLVTVLDGDANYRMAVMGQTTDFFIDMVEHSDWSESVGVGFNVDIVQPPPPAPPIPTFTGWPSFDYSEGIFRSVVTNKIINRNGILIEQQNFSDGSKAITKNLMFDAATGTPLLSSVTNDFDEPVYSYSYAGHWAYDGMGAASKNINAIFRRITTNSSGEFLIANASSYFIPGDEVELLDQVSNTRTTYWVSSVATTNDRITLVDSDGNLAAGLSGGSTSATENILRIIRSGRRNQQAVNNGKIVSLSNPVTDRKFPVLDALNTVLDNNSEYTPYSFTDCLTGESYTAAVTFETNKVVITANGCEMNIEVPFTPTSTSIYNYRFYKRGDKILVADNSTTPATEYLCKWTGETACFNECLENVLHADAQRFSDNWSFNYADAGNPLVDNSSTLLSAVEPNNRYRYGTLGIWRNQSSYVYQVDRKQTTPKTKIGTDGVYDNFALYKWNGSNPVQWSFVSEVTRYNPYGYEVENRDALGRYSSALYGYNNSVVTAVAGNASYFETAYDGFEDYENDTYYSSSLYGGHGHLNLLLNGSSNITTLNTNESHTGRVSLYLNNQTADHTVSLPAATPNYFTPQFSTSTSTKKYFVSAWFRPDASGITPKIVVKQNTTVLAQSTVPANNPVIEGWQKIDLEFAMPVSYTGSFTISFQFTGGTASGYVDDIRVQPFKSAISTYVYDPKTLWLTAELDNQNFATFYNYDEEGSLVQVKKETVNGVMTIQSSRNNVKRP